MAFTQPGPDRMDVQILTRLKDFAIAASLKSPPPRPSGDTLSWKGYIIPAASVDFLTPKNPFPDFDKAIEQLEKSARPDPNKVPPSHSLEQLQNRTLRHLFLYAWDNAIRPANESGDPHSKSPAYDKDVWKRIEEILTAARIISP